MPANDQLTALDATFLELEQSDDSALMHIGAALVFEAPPSGVPPTIGQLREHLGERLSQLPRYSQIVLTSGTASCSASPINRMNDRRSFHTDDETCAVVAHLRHANEYDPFPFASRLDPLKASLGRLEPPVPQPNPCPR